MDTITTRSACGSTGSTPLNAGVQGPRLSRHTFHLLHEEPDASGSGSGAGTGTGSGAGAGTGSGSGAPAHVDLTDDSLVKFPGMDAPVKYGEYKTRFVDRNQTQELVREIVKAAAQGRQPQPQIQQTAPAQARDPFAEIEGLPLVDGRTVATIAKQFRDGLITRDQAITKLETKIAALEKSHGASQDDRLNRDYTVERNQIIASLPIPKTDSPIPGLSDALAEFVDGVFWKYNFERPESRKEFAPTVKKEFEALRKAFREMEKAELEAAQKRSRDMRFQRPSAGTSPGGKAPARESNRDIARRMFGGVEQRT